MFSRFLAKNVGSTSSFRSHFQQINRVCRSKPLVTKLPGSPKLKSLAYTHSNIQCSFMGAGTCLDRVTSLYLLRSMPGTTCKTGFSQIHEESSVELDWGGMVYPSPHHAASPDWRYLWRSCKTAVQSWWKKGWRTALINGLCHVLGDLKIICCLLEWIVFQTPPKRFQVSLILRH